MFLSGPAGSGKSTAMRVAEQFCYEFFLAVVIMWSDTTFLFTAYIGAAASLIGGTTISRTAYLNKKDPSVMMTSKSGKMYKFWSLM